MPKKTPRSQAADSPAAPTPTESKPRSRPSNRAVAPMPETTEIASRPAEADDAPMLVEPSEHDIRMRAYERYMQRGGGHGMDFDDWLEAERELKYRR